jgi:hypothetical protein
MTLEGLNDDFRDLLVELADAGVEFVSVGAFALAFHGAPLLTEISGVSFEEAWASREPAEIDGRPVHIIGREAFLKNKQASGRPKDLADVARLTRRSKRRGT